jgi:hypothetical protein
MIYARQIISFRKFRPSLWDLEYLRINPGVETPGYCHASLCDDQTPIWQNCASVTKVRMWGNRRIF